MTRASASREAIIHAVTAMFRLVLLICLGAVAGCSTGASSCANPDGQTQIATRGGCLVIKTFAAAAPATGDVLFVVVHGDGSTPGPSVYHYDVARLLGASGPPGTTAVAIIRPGYSDDRGHTSDGESNGHRDNYTAQNIAMVADAITALKASHAAGRVIGVGHSGGAAILGDILGKYPGLLDAAVLVSCPCDLARWRSAGHSRPWLASESPSSYVPAVPLDAHVVLISGTADINTAPDLSQDYVAALAARHVDATLVLVPGAGHNDVFRSPLVVSVAAGLASR